jgi:hypothetical protein
MGSAKPLRAHALFAWLGGAVIFALNALVCKRLFFLNFSIQMGSIESAYMSISRYAMRHWTDHSWFPLWYTGMPFNRMYQPGLHLAVAALASVARWPVPVAYHFLTALAYCVGPVTLFVLCLGATRSRPFAFLTALIYTLFSPLNFLVPILRADIGGYLNPRRLQILIQYGEGPHTAALAVLPIAILFLHRAVTDRDRLAALFAAVAMAAVVITNWPGSIGLSMAVAAYLLSRMGQLHWPTFLVICAGGYLLVSPWILPSTILFVQRNAQQSDGTMLGTRQVLAASAILLLCLVLHGFFRAMRTEAWTRFFGYFLLLSGAVTLGHFWFDLRLLPQPNRFQPEMEMALAGVIASVALAGFRRLPRGGLAWVAIGLFAAVCLVQLRQDVRYARDQIRKIDIQSTVEYRMAKAFERLEYLQRVFAPGSVSYWMNMFTDTPQVAGCCDQGIPTMEHRIATFVIYKGLNAGDRDAAVSILWLQAYGAHAVGVTGKHSTEWFRPFINPEKFNGVLRELWRDGDDVIFEVPQHSRSLAHIVNFADVIRRAPVNGLDTEPLEPYVRAIENPDYPQAEFVWINQHQAQVKANLAADQLLSVQITADPGWHARLNGAERPVTPDALGMMVIAPRCSGACVVDLSFEATPELRWMRVAQIGGVVMGLSLMVWGRNRKSGRPGKSAQMGV